ncbi:hypothetical protein D3C87_1894950 [compost metagenome]
MSVYFTAPANAVSRPVILEVARAFKVRLPEPSIAMSEAPGTITPPRTTSVATDIEAAPASTTHFTTLLSNVRT